jgi:hypothetical protein
MTITRARTQNHHWTDEEREIIRRDYRGNTKSVRELAGKIGASFFGVKGQIQKMGLSLIKKHTWTPQEEDYLREIRDGQTSKTDGRLLPP